MKKINSFLLKTGVVAALAGSVAYFGLETNYLEASSHRDAPLISNDPLADNADVYAFRSPDDTTTVTLIATYVPMQLPSGGPNYASFGENIRYEVHVKNSTATVGDDVTYRFTFKQVNEDPTTFFNIRLGKENLKTSYICEKSVKGGAFSTIITNGIVPPPNIGPRSIDSSGIGLGKSYDVLMKAAIATATTGEKIYCGPSDDPFFVDLGGIFDLGQTRATNGPLDATACKNIHTIAIKVPISSLQKDGKAVTAAKNILDGDFVIGVWASAARQQITTLSALGAKPTTSGSWIQVSRLGMPLTNEAVIPIGQKDEWNARTPYNEGAYTAAFTNPELGLYMDDAQFGTAVPALSKLRIQRASKTVLGAVDFGNTKDGLFVLYGNPATTGTALDTAIFGKILLQKGAPRSVDLLPIFYTGVPNLAPYQLATGKTAGNPLSAGKPFINNFLPTLGDMLRLNMATPITPRNSPAFNSEGIIAAAVSGLTDTNFNKNTSIQNIPNMDGFPNGRRLEDDVTRIELQAVSGVALAAVGLWYDDYVIGGSPLTPKLLNVLGYTTGVENNDKAFTNSFPFVAAPHSGFGICGGYAPPKVRLTGLRDPGTGGLNIGAPQVLLAQNYPNPFSESTTMKYHVASKGQVSLAVYDLSGRLINIVSDEQKLEGDYQVDFAANGLPSGNYFAAIAFNGQLVQTVKIVCSK